MTTQQHERPTVQPPLGSSQPPSLPARLAPTLDEVEDVALTAAPYLTLVLMVSILGCAAVVMALLRPDWVTALVNSITAPDHKMYWYITRSSAFVALGLLWLSMVLGLAITNRMARVWPGGPTLNDLHEHASLLGLAFTGVHMAVLLGDQYATFTPAQILLPFASSSYRPIWVGLGQIGFYAALVVTISFSMRRWIGHRAWRTLHYLSFGVFVLALVHGLFSGSDSTAVWARDIYWGAATTVAGLCAYRMLIPRRVPALAASAGQEG